MILRGADPDYILSKIEKSLNILLLQKEYAAFSNFAWLTITTDNSIKALQTMQAMLLHAKDNNYKIDLDHKDLLFVESDVIYNCDGLQKFLLTKNI